MADVVANGNCVYLKVHHRVGCPIYKRNVFLEMLAVETPSILHEIGSQRVWPAIFKETEPDRLHLFVSIGLAIALAHAIKALTRESRDGISFSRFPRLGSNCRRDTLGRQRAA
ncbi:hypothetical protein MPNT_50152 [Candidatus Methylacidithermus pantelleriae]|uniref:Transposase IS200-like domain-containing protein n=2 Tax=Candidatus Methylacidithermus pantelleriae TaxID=2744239 RepID=A0A8J2BV07_9BACT|nr:hypothetical protein MPNT_50152 [Candidatus Methylacidithermus pantelleriae]